MTYKIKLSLKRLLSPKNQEETEYRPKNNSIHNPYTTMGQIFLFFFIFWKLRPYSSQKLLKADIYYLSFLGFSSMASQSPSNSNPPAAITHQ
jgi:hypothetical protein